MKKGTMTNFGAKSCIYATFVVCISTLVDKLTTVTISGLLP